MDADLQQKILLLLILFGGAWMSFRAYRLLNARKKGIDPAELSRRLEGKQDLLVLDVRSPGEFNGELGHIDGAVNLPVSELGQKLAEAKEELLSFRETEVVITCLRGPRASNALVQLERAGFKNVHVLNGGMAAWAAAKLPVVRS